MKRFMAGVIGFGVRVGLLFCLVAGFSAEKPSDTAARAKKARKSPGSDIFEGTNSVRLDITIATDGMKTLQHYWWGNGNQKKPEVKATIKEGTKVYKDVAIHLKGAAGSFRPIGDKPALTIVFDRYVAGQ